MNSAGKKRTVSAETNHELEKLGNALEPAARRLADADKSDLFAILDHGGIIPLSRADALKAGNPDRRTLPAAPHQVELGQLGVGDGRVEVLAGDPEALNEPFEDQLHQKRPLEMVARLRV